MKARQREAVDRRTDEAFARSGWRDPRLDYRDLLRRLKERDETSFRNAVHDYEAEVVERLSDPATDPVAAWLEYGARLAALVGGGRTVAIDRDGRSSEAPGATPGVGTLLLHLPANAGAGGIVVACPREPSDAQAATIALLAEGKTAL